MSDEHQFDDLDEPIDLEEMRHYTTVEGVTLTLRAVSPNMQQMRMAQVRDEFRARGEPVDPPMGTAQTVGGPEEYPLSADNLERPNDPEGTARNKALWAAHQSCLQRLNEEMERRVVLLLLARGVAFDEPEREGWVEEQEELGFEIPEGRLERRLWYLRSEILTSAQDLIEVTRRIQALSTGFALPAQSVRAAQASFQRAVQTGRRVVDGPDRPAAEGEPVAAPSEAD